VKIEKLSAEWILWRRNLPKQLDFDLPLRIWAQEKVILGLDLDEDSGGLRRERIGVEQIQDVGGWSQFRNKITFIL
jgi:hypothetical protein